jgi:hypothetical protein
VKRTNRVVPHFAILFLIYDIFSKMYIPFFWGPGVGVNPFPDLLHESVEVKFKQLVKVFVVIFTWVLISFSMKICDSILFCV